METSTTVLAQTLPPGWTYKHDDKHRLYYQHTNFRVSNWEYPQRDLNASKLLSGDRNDTNNPPYPEPKVTKQEKESKDSIRLEIASIFVNLEEGVSVKHEYEGTKVTGLHTFDQCKAFINHYQLKPKLYLHIEGTVALKTQKNHHTIGHENVLSWYIELTDYLVDTPLWDKSKWGSQFKNNEIKKTVRVRRCINTIEEEGIIIIIARQV